MRAATEAGRCLIAIGKTVPVEVAVGIVGPIVARIVPRINCDRSRPGRVNAPRWRRLA